MSDFDDTLDDDDDFDEDDFDDIPVPAHLAFLDEAACQVVPPKWIEHPPWRAPTFAAVHLRILTDVFHRLNAMSKSEVKECSEWIWKRMAEEAYSRGTLVPTAGRMHAVFRLIGALARANVSPFTTVGDADERSEYTGPPATCEATETDPAECMVTPIGGESSYLLSHAAADRVLYRNLSPIEYYRLVIRHGRGSYYLWPDFYGCAGETYQAMFPPTRSSKHRIPTFAEVRGDLEQLLNYAFFNFQLDQRFVAQPDVVAALKSFAREDVESELDARIAARPTTITNELCWQTRIELGYVDERRLRDRWREIMLRPVTSPQNNDVPSLARDSVPIIGGAATIELVMDAVQQLAAKNLTSDAQSHVSVSSISFDLRHCMGSDMLLELVFWMLSNWPTKRCRPGIMPLSDFRDDRVLDWIEKNIYDPLYRESDAIEYEWGSIAVMNGVSWDRITKWLAIGRPLSLVALDAMRNCCGYDGKTMSGIFASVSPKVAGRPAAMAVEKLLTAYAQADPDPRVTQQIQIILKNLDMVFDNQ